MAVTSSRLENDCDWKATILEQAGFKTQSSHIHLKEVVVFRDLLCAAMHPHCMHFCRNFLRQEALKNIYRKIHLLAICLKMHPMYYVSSDRHVGGGGQYSVCDGYNVTLKLLSNTSNFRFQPSAFCDLSFTFGPLRLLLVWSEPKEKMDAILRPRN